MFMSSPVHLQRMQLYKTVSYAVTSNVVRPLVLSYTEASVCIITGADLRFWCVQGRIITVNISVNDSRLWRLFFFFNALIGNGPVMSEICVKLIIEH